MRQATEIKQNVIVLTRDPALLHKLRNKLQDYATRFMAVASAPETDPDTLYKYRLLSDLLEKQILDTEAWKKEFAKASWFAPSIFLNAVMVITAYNRGDLGQVHGGGLG